MSSAAAGNVNDLVIRHSCPSCGRRCYAGRKQTRRAARRLYPGKHMRAYRCGGYWHMTGRFDRQKKSNRGPGTSPQPARRSRMAAV